MCLKLSRWDTNSLKDTKVETADTSSIAWLPLNCRCQTYLSSWGSSDVEGIASFLGGQRGQQSSASGLVRTAPLTAWFANSTKLSFEDLAKGVLCQKQVECQCVFSICVSPWSSLVHKRLHEGLHRGIILLELGLVKGFCEDLVKCCPMLSVVLAWKSWRCSVLASKVLVWEFFLGWSKIFYDDLVKFSPFLSDVLVWAPGQET